MTDNEFSMGLLTGCLLVGILLLGVILENSGYEKKQECTTADSVTICRDVKYGEWYVKEGKCWKENFLFCH